MTERLERRPPMTGRVAALADAAIHLVATKGMRGLTHRAVDAQAGLPQGTTSAYFRTRKALIEGLVRRLAEVEQAELELDPADLAGSIAHVLEAWLTTGRERTLARYACMLEATHHTELRDILVHGVAPRERAEQLVQALGSTDPKRDGAHLVAFLEGLLFYNLVGAGSTQPLPDLKSAVEKALRL
ncbi:TetR family transcriptional regulator [Lentzea sp. NBRC 105346]|uniref:TetR/AcrR family transcriptional regulator n=1 Tax=Lentzea sp. NBRC 105346 TaxID=3032205 RepID=UPI002556A566|nr:TetR family transcriptional regulator [Lentzea sp. NBRC 105346]GLZ33907.1 TetR family transcriptional regulator [Lentzea sp. NBRC 105346]